MIEKILYSDRWGSHLKKNDINKRRPGRTYLKDIIHASPVISHEKETKEAETTIISPKDGNTNTTPVEKLLPIMEPMFNLREIVKQIALLEDHLNIGGSKACFDCIMKHFLVIEAYSEEMLALNKNDELLLETKSLPSEIRALQKGWYEETKTNLEIQQELRKIRKRYMNKSFGIIFEDAKNKKNCKECKV